MQREAVERTRRVHELKTHPSYFRAALAGLKPFEVRKNDRDYCAGDVLRLVEWDPAREAPFQNTGRAMLVLVTYVLPGGRFGIDPAYCVMGIQPNGDTHG